jgi:hypothetical protein
VCAYNFGKYTSKSLKTTDLEDAKAMGRLFFKKLSLNGVYKVKHNPKRAISQ